ncbi:carbonic anhydrase [Plakobranchus ocellatus]|uniref:Carbonic anhydrase n=1 Tax=Plakobranchus ocellatus TaxID=259542 RepID=A0AAV3ZZ34_9GAST|nr:carbonic anhydrase [Plakobranchus ocellatus]
MIEPYCDINYKWVKLVKSLIISFSISADWTYSGTHGPANWHLDFPDCQGMTQSPINIDVSKVLFNPQLKQFDLSEYSKTSGIEMRLVNKGGHTAEVEYSGDKIHLLGGNLPDKYVLAQFHFHWGSASRRGSEHKLDGKAYPMELHLVHYQEHLNNLSYAAPHPSGLAVLGYFFKIGAHNKNFEQLLNYFPQIKTSDQHIEIPTFPLLDLLPSAKVNFYRYSGSLTTPPCSETVIWSISTSFIEIAEEQMFMFRDLYDKENHTLADDFRPLQELNQRIVESNDPRFSDDNDGSGYITASTAAVTLSLLLSLWFQ